MRLRGIKPQKTIIAYFPAPQAAVYCCGPKLKFYLIKPDQLP